MLKNKNKEIAEEYGLSLKTIVNYKNNPKYHNTIKALDLALTLKKIGFKQEMLSKVLDFIEMIRGLR